MKILKGFLPFIAFIAVSGFGGYLVSLTGLPIGWMIGTLLTAALLSIFYPHFIQLPKHSKGLPKCWMFLGQAVLGIELGQRINSTVLEVFRDNWVSVVFMLVLSLLFSLAAGWFLWKFSKLDMLTSMFAAVPGGASSMPGIAEEFGANTGVVSIVQTLRAFLVIVLVPVVFSFLFGHKASSIPAAALVHADFQWHQLAVTLLLAVMAVGGYWIGKVIKLPAPWLIGSMISVAALKVLGSVVMGYEFLSWWPKSFLIISQVLIGASIGSRLTKEMFAGLTRTLLVSVASIAGMVLAMFGCAYFVSAFSNISLLTAGLAFAPGGIAEMSTTALVLNGDATFVVAVQVLRVIIACVAFPLLFKVVSTGKSKKKSIVLHGKGAH